ncbi:MAG: Lipid A core--O-antigen ligase-like protein [bacterium P3]|nr:MAG: Lipid A core--O-antigen ligase-like protein [bacterium P201]KWW30458.1 MAG: Lipid A core--O-antigen ligase-like protein [bacterium P3]KWW41345.1 MAG: Lipid A core--O-antigen ligase-like protein [bacterium F083]
MTLSTRTARRIALSVAIVYMVATAVALYQDQMWPLLIPVAAAAIALCVTRIEETLVFIAFCTPFAIDVAVYDGMELSVPTEPLMILVSAVFLFRVLAVRTYDKALLRHPVSVLLLLSLGWMLATALVSNDTAVSLKYLAARLWFVIPFYFAAATFFRNPHRIRQLFGAYATALAVVVVVTTCKTLGNVQDLQVLHRVMRPFYNDHTAYGCVTALFLPGTIHYIFERGAKVWQRMLYIALTMVLATGLAFSYCRAAWISLAGACGIYLMIRWGMKLKWMALIAVAGIGMFFAHQSDILYKMSKNTQDSSLTLSGQIQSISNISTDASNLERLNRWACAFRMFAEKPLSGYGPGTYQFFYGSYQRSDQLSTISTNAGDLGNAHSEYIGPLAEQGVMGLLLVTALFLCTFATGVRVHRTAADPAMRTLALTLTLCLTTYYIHGFFNNFLDTDKLSVPFWAFTAAIVSIDRYAEKRPEAGRLHPATKD